MHGIPADRIIVTGAPKFDEWFERTPATTREEFAAKVGLDPARPFVLYACSSPFIAPDEVGFVRRWLGRLREDARSDLRELGVLVRPHPQNAEPVAAGSTSATLGNVGDLAARGRAAGRRRSREPTSSTRSPTAPRSSGSTRAH